jgi:hypothetical protein
VRIWTDSTKTIRRDLTGWKIRAQVRAAPGAVPVLTFDTNNGTIITVPVEGESLGAAEGEFLLVASSVDTGELTPDRRNAVYTLDAILYKDDVAPAVVEGIVPATPFVALAPITA